MLISGKTTKQRFLFSPAVFSLRTRKKLVETPETLEASKMASLCSWQCRRTFVEWQTLLLASDSLAAKTLTKIQLNARMTVHSLIPLMFQHLILIYMDFDLLQVFVHFSPSQQN